MEDGSLWRCLGGERIRSGLDRERVLWYCAILSLVLDDPIRTVGVAKMSKVECEKLTNSVTSASHLSIVASHLQRSDLATPPHSI
jgi:hypothetical protein